MVILLSSFDFVQLMPEFNYTALLADREAPKQYQAAKTKC
jgi:hypothetical protein